MDNTENLLRLSRQEIGELKSYIDELEFNMDRQKTSIICMRKTIQRLKKKLNNGQGVRY